MDEEEEFEDSFEEVRPLSPFPAGVLDFKSSIINVTNLSSNYLIDNTISKSILEHTSGWIKSIASNDALSSHKEETIEFKEIRFPAFYRSLHPPDTDTGRSQF